MPGTVGCRVTKIKKKKKESLHQGMVHLLKFMLK